MQHSAAVQDGQACIVAPSSPVSLQVEQPCFFVHLPEILLLSPTWFSHTDWHTACSYNSTRISFSMYFHTAPDRGSFDEQHRLYGVQTIKAGGTMDNRRRRRLAVDTQTCGRELGRNTGHRSNFLGGSGTGGIFCRLQNSRLEPETTGYTSEAVVESPVRTYSADLKTLKEQAERMSRALQELERQIITLEEKP